MNTLTPAMRHDARSLDPPGDLLCPEETCTGCAACFNVCPAGALEMTENAWAEMVPRVDRHLCTRCGRCTDACPVVSPPRFVEPRACYAVWSDDPEDRAECSSGGLAAVLARCVLADGGAVFAAAWDPGAPGDPPRVVHTAARDAAGARAHRKSKYVQSRIGSAYQQAGGLLKEGTPVAFFGTPCQVAGLKGFLGRDHEALVTVDFVCHGVPPARYLAEHIRSIAPHDTAVTGVTFRDDDGFRLKLFAQNACIYNRPWYRDVYYYGFWNGVTYRDGCYACLFARSERCSDVTVGDFWGLDRTSLAADPGGRASLSLVNTEKGAALFGAVRDDVHAEVRPLAEAVAGNTQLRRSSVAHARRGAFHDAYPDAGFTAAMKAAGVSREIAFYSIKESPTYRSLQSIKKRVVARISGSPRRAAR